MKIESDHEDLKKEIVSIARKMNLSGINQGFSGNISARLSSSNFLITPSSIPYEILQSSEIMPLDFSGNILLRKNDYSSLKPSSEWRLHAEILSTRPEINAILHCHSVNATALACHRKSIPSFHYMVAMAGGLEIPCSEYFTFGTHEFAKNASKTIKGKLACLLANHGQITLGSCLKDAYNLAIEVETLAKIYLKASQLGEPLILSNEQMNLVNEQFKSIGYKKQV